MAGRITAASIALLASLPAQIPGVPNAAKPAPAEAKPVNDAERLKAWAEEARAQLARIDEHNGNGVPAGITPNDVAARRSDLDQTLSTVERHQRVLQQTSEAKTALAAAQKKDADWAGFPAKDRISVLFVDDLRNQREAAARKLATHESTLNLIDRNLATQREASAAAEEQQRRAAEAADKNQEPTAKWRMDSARFKVRALTAQLDAAQASITLHQTQLASARAELALLDKQLAEASPKQTFSDADLAQIRKAADDRKAALQKEADAARKRLSSANSALKKAQETAPADAADPAAELAKLRVEAAQSRIDALEFLATLFESARQIETFTADAYAQRMALFNAKDGAARAEARHQIEVLVEKLKPWDVYASNELSLVSAEQDRNGSRSGAIPAGDPRLAPLQEQRDALWEKSEAIRRIDQNVKFQRQNFQAWLIDADHASARRPWHERAGERISYAWSRVKRVWSYEVFTYDDAGIKKGVTFGRLLGALVYFGIGYWFMLWLSGKVQDWMVSHKRIAGAQANTIRRWLMVFIAFLLVLSTLHFMKIPLTVFAFLGGALAIGLGFGTQTLIKNFISGIILLFERKVRVGDILTIDGVVGTVTEINTRSSIIRSGDGVETLIPNSEFLEKKVTNWTHSNRRVRATIRVNIAYGSDPTRASEILLDCASRHGLVLKDPAPSVLFEEFGADAMIFALNVWVELNEKSNTGLVTSDLRFIIEKRFGDIGFALPSKDMRLILPERAAAADLKSEI